jgi:tripartite-type tricarboxylate transporter receptor subunit TctC
LFAPAGTPKPIIAKLQAEVTRVVREPDFTCRYMDGLGLEPILNSPDEFARFLREDRARAEVMVKRSGLQAQ